MTKITKRVIGKKFWRLMRVFTHLARVNQILLFFGALRLLEIPWWVVGPIAPLALIGTWWFDKNIAYPGEAEASLQENPEWIETKQKYWGKGERTES